MTSKRQRKKVALQLPPAGTPLQNGNIYFRLENELVSLGNCRHSAAQPDSRPGDQG